MYCFLRSFKDFVHVLLNKKVICEVHIFSVHSKFELRWAINWGEQFCNQIFSEWNKKTFTSVVPSREPIVTPHYLHSFFGGCNNTSGNPSISFEPPLPPSPEETFLVAQPYRLGKQNFLIFDNCFKNITKTH